MTEEQKPSFRFGPIENWRIFNQFAQFFSTLGYMVFIRVTNSGWEGELKDPVIGKDNKNERTSIS